MQPATTNPIGVRWRAVNCASVGASGSKGQRETGSVHPGKARDSNATLRARKSVQESLPASSPMSLVLQSRDSVVGNDDKLLPPNSTACNAGPCSATLCASARELSRTLHNGQVRAARFATNNAVGQTLLRECGQCKPVGSGMSAACETAPGCLATAGSNMQTERASRIGSFEWSSRASWLEVGWGGQWLTSKRAKRRRPCRDVQVLTFGIYWLQLVCTPEAVGRIGGRTFGRCGGARFVVTIVSRVLRVATPGRVVPAERRMCVFARVVMVLLAGCKRLARDRGIRGIAVAAGRWRSRARGGRGRSRR